MLRQGRQGIEKQSLDERGFGKWEKQPLEGGQRDQPGTLKPCDRIESGTLGNAHHDRGQAAPPLYPRRFRLPVR
ncbi:MAG: hypothetical protein Kilf2KO_24620 [Rhodospirillales bacterium]